MCIRDRGNNVPGAQVKRIVALAFLGAARFERRGAVAKIGKVAFGAAGQILMVAGHRIDAIFVPPPGRAKAVVELLQRPLLVGNVANGEDCARQVIEQCAGIGVPFKVALGDVPGRNHHGVFRLAGRPGRPCGGGVRDRPAKESQRRQQSRQYKRGVAQGWRTHVYLCQTRPNRIAVCCYCNQHSC